MKTTPDPDTLPAFYSNYVSLVQHHDVLEALKHSGLITDDYIRVIPEKMGEFRYAEGKWSIKEVVCHMMDAERIFGYRALCFARNDKTPLPGFEENDYAPSANAHGRSLIQLADEMQRLRASTVDLFQGFTPEMLGLSGSVNNKIISVVNIGYVIAGHETHHRNILRDRYLSAL